MLRNLVGSSCRSFVFCLAVIAFSSSMAQVTLAGQPKVGDKATAFKAKDLSGKDGAFDPGKLEGPAVLVFLRGFPGYQCPICSRQVGQLVAKAEDFAGQKAQVIFVYPGPKSNLMAKAKQFTRNKELPEGFQMFIDGDYKITNAYDLRWEAPRETAYPTTLVIDSTGVIRFAKVSKSHGGRTSPEEVLKAVSELKQVK